MPDDLRHQIAIPKKARHDIHALILGRAQTGLQAFG